MENSASPIIAQTKSKKKTYIIGGIVFAVLLLVGAAATFWLTQQEQDVRQQASTGGIADGQCLTLENGCDSNQSYSDTTCPLPYQRCGVKPTSGIADGKCLPPGEVCDSGKDYADQGCALTARRCGVKPTSGIADGKCLPPGEVCDSGKDYADQTCDLTARRCGVKPPTCAEKGGTCYSNSCEVMERENIDGYCDDLKPDFHCCGEKTDPLPACANTGDNACSTRNCSLDGRTFISNASCPEGEFCCSGPNPDPGKIVKRQNGDCLEQFETAKDNCMSGVSYVDPTCPGTIPDVRCGYSQCEDGDYGTCRSGDTCPTGSSKLSFSCPSGKICCGKQQYPPKGTPCTQVKPGVSFCTPGESTLCKDMNAEEITGDCSDPQAGAKNNTGGYCCKPIGTGGGGGGGTTPPTTTPTSKPTATPTPPVGPMCLSIKMSIASPKINDSVTFTCGQVAGAKEYIFRIIDPDNKTTDLGRSSRRVSAAYLITKPGKYFAQCQICMSEKGNCNPWEDVSP